MHPVIRQVPDAAAGLSPQQKRAALSRLARECARLSGKYACLEIDRFQTSARGVPMPVKGIFWSITHKPGAVGGVVADFPVGMDIEQIRPVSTRVFNRIVSSREAVQFAGQDANLLFFRAFTAKEAVLKMLAIGLKGLEQVTISSVENEKNMVIQYLDHQYGVENFYFGSYLATITQKHCKVHWTIEQTIQGEHTWKRETDLS